MATSSSNIQSLGAAGLYGTYTALGGGGTFARDELDGMRMGVGRTPEAEYPDGYLGAIPSRRGDRLLDSVKDRQNERSYSRGVHVGTRVSPRDYFWPTDQQPDRGLKREARGLRQAPLLELTPPPHLVNDGKTDTPNELPGEINPARAVQFLHLRPSWG